jgi:hypothetical protein
MSAKPPDYPDTKGILNRELVLSHAFGLGFSIPLCLAFIDITSNGLKDILPVAILLFGVVLTLPWSPFALVLYFLGIDGHLYEPLERALPYLMAAIMVPGAYFNGYQFGGFLEGVLKRRFRTRDIA